MAATFVNTLPATRDWVRWRLADTNVPDGALRQDEEYDAVIAMYPNRLLAAAEMAESLANEYAQQPDTFSQPGEVSVSWKERVSTWLTTARVLRAKAAEEAAPPAEAAAAYGSVAPERDYPPDLGEYRRAATGWT